MSTRTKLAANPALKAFVDYYVCDEGIKAVTDVQYIGCRRRTSSRRATTWQRRSLLASA